MAIMDIPQDHIADDVPVLSPSAMTGSEAAATVAGLLAPEAIDALLAGAGQRGMTVDGPGGLNQQMIGAVLERVLERKWPIIWARSVARLRRVASAGTTATATPPRR